MVEEWTDRMTGARMQVDREFQHRVRESQFTNQQWGLIMTAVEFRIENPDTPEKATLVADTGKVEHVMPELEAIGEGMHGRPGASQDQSGGGLLGKLRGLFGGGADDEIDPETLDAATALVEEYTGELQAFLEEQGQWATICDDAARG